VSDALSSLVARTEAEFFRTLNIVVEPLVRAGCGSPGILPTGLIVLETTGARSGQPRRIPLVATVFDRCVFLSTVRGDRSQWVRNIAADPAVRYWLAGREERGRARLFAPGRPLPSTEGMPVFARTVAESLLPPATLFGWCFAVIAPD